MPVATTLRSGIEGNVKILVINSGSSSLKYQLFDMAGPSVLASGLVERIGDPPGRLEHRWQAAGGEARRISKEQAIDDHRQAFALIAGAITESDVVPGDPGLDGIGHRVVHGGEAFSAPTRIDREVVQRIRELFPLAPLHNPANLMGIEMALEHWPQVPQIAVFDTAFHCSLPAHAYRYPLPEAWYQDHGLRRYGFHGTSHQYVASQAAEYLATPPASLNLITLHLGNGASAAAVEGGRCVDTSMGLTPLEGLVMGTRCGDIDPAIPFFMTREAGISPRDVEAHLNRDSGLKGLCGVSDMREVLSLVAAGDARAELALEAYCYRMRKYIGAYLAVLGRLDALVFTAGVGENAPAVRARACAGLEPLGILLDEARNQRPCKGVMEIQAAAARTRVLVIPTNEELAIARQTATAIAAGAR